MKWTIRIEFSVDGKEPSSCVVGTITRPVVDVLPEQIGLSLEEGQQLLRGVQMAILADQSHRYELGRVRCSDCGRRQRIKDTRCKCVQTAFGAFRLRGRRYWVCQCRAQSMDTLVFPLGEIISRRTTPEVRYLFAELGASMPYRQASRILRTCGLGPMRASHSAIRRHTIGLGRRLERERIFRDVPSESEAATSMVVGIDDTYIRHREPRESRQLQVTAGRIERNGALGARFAFVSWTPIWNAEQVQGFLRQHGGGNRTKMRVVTDGDDGLRNLVQRSMSQTVDPQLAWFHIGMRLERLLKIVQMPVSYREFMENPNASRPAELLVARLRNAPWRGRPWKALVAFTGLRAETNRWMQEPWSDQPSVRPPTYLRLLLCASACVPLHGDSIIGSPLSPLQPAESIGF